MRKRNPTQSPAKDFILRVQAAMINLILQDGTTVETLDQNLASKMQKVGEKLLATDPSLQQSAMDMMNDPRLLTNPDAIIQEIVESYSEMVGSPAPAAKMPLQDELTYWGEMSPLHYQRLDAENVWNEEDYQGLGVFVPDPIDCFCPNLLDGHKNNCRFKS